MSKTVDINELVKRLRERAALAATEGNMTATCDARYFTQSADAIRALEAEVERLKGVLGKIANLDPSQEPWARTMARKALEAKP